jgi:hypothetical protein
VGLAQKGEGGRGSLLAAAPKSAKGEGATVALFYKGLACPPHTSSMLLYRNSHPQHSDVYLGPHEHPLRRAALCLTVVLILLVLLQVARPLRSAEGCCGGRIRGIVLLAHFSCNSARRKIHRIQRLRHLLARPDISALKTAASSNRPDIQ